MEELFAQQRDFPFFVSMVPALTITIVMIMCTYLQGGRVAGQVPLHDSLEHQQKVDMMNDDNEYETDFLGNTGIASTNNSKEDKKRPTKYAAAPERPPFVSEEDGNEGVETFSPMVMRMPSSRAEMTAFSPMALRLSSAREETDSDEEDVEI